MSSLSLQRALSACAILVLVVACRTDKQSPADADNASRQPAAQTAGPLTPAPGGKIIEVMMVSDGEGNYFQPKEVHANRGDVVRFTLKVGVHNVHFVADSNAGKTGYPTAPSEFLQLPGQTYDVAASMSPGTYYFQCDPHAALGMTGRVIVH
jgi:plastocyanin